MKGGGTSGGPLQGTLTVYVHANYGVTEAPITSATVVLVAADQAWLKKTDDLGRAVFHDGALTSTVDVHVFARGFDYRSYGGITSASLSVLLEHDPYESATRARITGRPAILEELATTEGSIPFVLTQPIDARARYDTTPEGRRACGVTEMGIGSHIAWSEHEAFRVGFGIGASPALLLLGGSIAPSLHFLLCLGAPPFEAITHMAVFPGVGHHDEVLARPVELMPLTESLHILFRERTDGSLTSASFSVSAPGLPAQTRSFASYLRPSDVQRLRVPALDGPLAGGTYHVEATELRRATPPWDAATWRSRHFVARPERLLVADDWLSPPFKVEREGRGISWQSEVRADLHRLRVSPYRVPTPKWHIEVFGSHRKEITLPPAPNGFFDPLDETVYICVSTFELPEIDFADFRFREFAHHVRASAGEVCTF